MKRPHQLVRIFVFLLLVGGGAIINVAVAWTVSNTVGELYQITGRHAGLKYEITRQYADGTLTRSRYPEGIAVGWPLPALVNEPASHAGVVGSMTILPASRIELPRQPVWPGFAINTLFYAGILYLLFAVPFTIRRHRRVRRGLCPKCAYPVGTSEVCTECGAAVKRRSPRRPYP
jgi:hypothetical protein